MNDERQIKVAWEAKSIGRNRRVRPRRSGSKNLLKKKEKHRAQLSESQETGRNVETLQRK